jgi:hypothetical protein
MSEAADSWLKSRNLPRLAFSVALAPPVAGALLALILSITVFNGRIFLVPGPEGGGQMVGADIGEIATNLFMAITNGFILGALIGWPVMLVIGLPLHAFLLRKTSASVWIYIFAGIAAGVAGGAARALSSSAAVAASELTQALAIGAVTGTLAAFIFWYVRRPDRDTAEYKT